MKRKLVCLALPTMLLLASCASSPVTLAPVGPNPALTGSRPGGNGFLRVFSGRTLVTEGYDGADSSLHQHSPYQIFDAHGRLVKYVDNTTGEYATAPAVIALQPGSYLVRARAKDLLNVQVPVVIESGRTTRVHLDDRWRPPAGVPATELVIEPGGGAVGWRSGLIAHN